MKTDTKKMMRLAEDASARYLFEKGYEIVARNWTAECSEEEPDELREIQIVARDGDALVFAWVSIDDEFVFDSKEHAELKRASDAFLKRYGPFDGEVRFDAIYLKPIDGDTARICHWIDLDYDYDETDGE